MTEARRWTLFGGQGPLSIEIHADGPDLGSQEGVEVIEAQPILTEREQLKAEAERWEKSAAQQSKTCHAFDVENRGLRAERERMLDLLEGLLAESFENWRTMPDGGMTVAEGRAREFLRQAGRNQPKEAASEN